MSKPQKNIPPTTQLVRGIRYQLTNRGRRVRLTPWLCDLFAFVYDRILARSVFPKKFGTGLEAHTASLAAELRAVPDALHDRPHAHHQIDHAPHR